ncbi:Aquaporin PIP-type [Trichinella spiralis]|uniref:Aquaporin PIP-type n=1 Tax=Trichinella spiralis TaxID=6334 RepID=A0ABR3KCT3_TRISP
MYECSILGFLICPLFTQREREREDYNSALWWTDGSIFTLVNCNCSAHLAATSTLDQCTLIFCLLSLSRLPVASVGQLGVAWNYGGKYYTQVLFI